MGKKRERGGADVPYIILWRWALYQRAISCGLTHIQAIARNVQRGATDMCGNAVKYRSFMRCRRSTMCGVGEFDARLWL